MKTSELSDKIYDSNDFPSYLPKLNQLYDELFAGGKKFRSFLIKKIGHSIQLKASTIGLLSQTIEFIHNASLLHDDLVDRSQLRRNKTTAWLKFSPEYAVLAGDYLLARVMTNLSSFGNLELIGLTAQTISNLLEGEWLQDSVVWDWEINFEKIDQVHRLKTSSLFQWCLVAPFISEKKSTQEELDLLNEMGILLGILFQRGDDLLDFNVRNKESKTVLGDLKSGYLNSFGIFLTRGIEKSLKMDVIQSETIEQIHTLLSPTYFKKKLKEFDNENEKLIELYFSYLEELFKINTNIVLKEALFKLPAWLYYRSKNGRNNY